MHVFEFDFIFFCNTTNVNLILFATTTIAYISIFLYLLVYTLNTVFLLLSWFHHQMGPLSSTVSSLSTTISRGMPTELIRLNQEPASSSTAFLSSSILNQSLPSPVAQRFQPNFFLLAMVQLVLGNPRLSKMFEKQILYSLPALKHIISSNSSHGCILPIPGTLQAFSNGLLPTVLFPMAL